MTYKGFRYNARRSSCVVSVNEMLEDLLSKYESPGNVFKSLQDISYATVSGNSFERGIVVLWSKFFMKKFFSDNFGIDDVLTKYCDEVTMTLVGSKECFKPLEEEKEEVEAATA